MGETRLFLKTGRDIDVSKEKKSHWHFIIAFYDSKPFNKTVQVSSGKKNNCGE